MKERILNFAGNSHWKHFLLNSIYLAQDNKLYQKDLMHEKAVGTCLSLSRYVNELIEMGVVVKNFEGRRAVICLQDDWKPVFREIAQDNIPRMLD